MKKMCSEFPLTMLDLFAGAGGLSQGFFQAGFHSLYANEIQKRYSQTYALNHPNTVVDQQDIRQVDPGRIREKLGLRKGELDLIAGGPPCQGFSINAPKRSSDDARNVSGMFKSILSGIFPGPTCGGAFSRA